MKARRDNEFDGRFAVSGSTGNGKSTLIGKTLFRIKGFKPRKHQVYNREDVIDLLQNQQSSFCWDDEAIRTGYKREFQQKRQQELIKILTTYRDNFNIYASAIPNFFSLDKDLRDLFFLHLHVIERGIAIVHMPLQGRLYSQDKWDAKYNAKIEDNWSKRMRVDPNFKPPYHKLTTFKGYLYFNKFTKKQEAMYKEIKRIKRIESIEDNDLGITKTIKIDMDYIYNKLINRKLSKNRLKDFCDDLGRKYSVVNSQLNHMLNDNNIKESVNQFLKPIEDKSEIIKDIDLLIPKID